MYRKLVSKVLYFLTINDLPNPKYVLGKRASFHNTPQQKKTKKDKLGYHPLQTHNLLKRILVATHSNITYKSQSSLQLQNS